MTNADDKEMPRSEGGVVSLSRGLQILELLSERERGLSLADLSTAMGINKSIATRLLGGLENSQYVFRNVETGLYELTYRMSNLGLRKVASSRILNQCSGVIRRLATKTGELARLGVVEQGKVVTWVLAHTGEQRTLQIDPNYGLTISLHTHAASKAWLATLPFEQAWALMSANGLPRLTKYSKITRDELAKDLAECRQRGFALNLEENEIGVVAVAAPVLVRQVEGEVSCAGVVSLGAPVQRTSHAQIVEMAPLVVTAANELAKVWPLSTNRPKAESSESAAIRI